jgi:hypothetical protein
MHTCYCIHVILNDVYVLRYDDSRNRIKYCNNYKSVGIATATDWAAKFRFPTGAGISFFLYSVQAGPGPHTASYPVGSRASFAGVKTAGT